MKSIVHNRVYLAVGQCVSLKIDSLDSTERIATTNKRNKGSRKNEYEELIQRIFYCNFFVIYFTFQNN